MAKNLAPVRGCDGHIVRHVGKYARQAVLTAYEMNGGVEWLADWAKDNPSDFLTKLFPKIITREVDDAQEAAIEHKMERMSALPPPRPEQLVDMALDPEDGAFKAVDGGGRRE